MMKNGRFLTVFGAVFGGVGLILLLSGALYAVASSVFSSHAVRTDGTVVDVVEQTTTTHRGDGPSRRSTSYHPVVRFTADGRQVEFTDSSGSTPPAYAVGDEVRVAYDAGEPDNARIDSFMSLYLGPTIMGGIGLVFLPIGLVLFVRGRRQARRRAWLLANGTETWAELAGIGLDTNVRINNRHPYVVHARWYDERSGRAHTATSDHLRDDPTPMLRGRTHLRVLFDPADPDHNLVDLDTAAPPSSAYGAGR